jgi:membrane protein implicated in regulation of membrane protease activity
MTVFWLVTGFVLLGVEALTLAFFAVFVALGMFAAAVASSAGAASWVQVLAFVGVAGLGVLLARPPLLRTLRAHNESLALPGVQGLVGQHAVTVDVVGDTHHPGHALLAGERWLAVTDAAAPLGPDVTVTVAAVLGTTLLVRPLQSVPSS